MAKIKKPAKPEKPIKKTSLPEIRQWLENKTQEARGVAKPRAARAAKRYGAPAGVALIAFFIFLSFLLPQDQFQQAKQRLIINPQDFEAHLLLAEKYLENNQLPEAEKELLLAEQLQPLNKETNVLGAGFINLKNLWQRKRELNPKDIKQLISFWERIINEKPDYRDGYFQLTLLYYRLGENEKANQYLQEGLNLDPNFEPAEKLIKKLESS